MRFKWTAADDTRNAEKELTLEVILQIVSGTHGTWVRNFEHLEQYDVSLTEDQMLPKWNCSLVFTKVRAWRIMGSHLTPLEGGEDTTPSMIS